MLITQTEGDHSQAVGSRIGLALAGGGPLGVVYEIGALRALDEALEGIDFNNLHTYVGVSAGAAIAANLANQITTAQLCRIFISNDVEEHMMNPEIFLTPAFHEYYERLLLAPKLCWDAVWRFLRNPFDIGLLESFTSLSQALPTGFFNNETIHLFFNDLFNSGERTNDFRKLKQKLYVVAVELDTGAATIFGSKGYDHVPISKAVQASTALPGLYPPVTIDGRHYVDGALKKTLHASVALENGADLVLCVNPLVPFDASLAAKNGSPKHNKLIEGGMPVVMAQTFRALIYSRMKVGMGKYDTQYENADVILFEPNRDDSDMFFTNVFSFSNRTRVCEHAYQTTRRDLLTRRSALEPMLARHGIRLRVDILEDKNRHFASDLYDQDSIDENSQPQHDRIGKDLKQTLYQLQQWMHLAR